MSEKIRNDQKNLLSNANVRECQRKWLTDLSNDFLLDNRTRLKASHSIGWNFAHGEWSNHNQKQTLRLLHNEYNDEW